MKKVPLIYLVLFASIAITFASCKKSVETKIEGMWRRVNVVNASSSVFEDWSFSGGYLYVLQTSAGIGGYDTLSYGEFTIRTSLFKKFVSIEASSDHSMINEWTIDKLNNKQMILYKDNGGLEYREFTKE